MPPRGPSAELPRSFRDPSNFPSGKLTLTNRVDILPRSFRDPSARGKKAGFSPSGCLPFVAVAAVAAAAAAAAATAAARGCPALRLLPRSFRETFRDPSAENQPINCRFCGIVFLDHGMPCRTVDNPSAKPSAKPSAILPRSFRRCGCCKTVPATTSPSSDAILPRTFRGTCCVNTDFGNHSIQSSPYIWV